MPDCSVKKDELSPSYVIAHGDQKTNISLLLDYE